MADESRHLPASKTVVFALYDKVTLQDVAAPLEIFARANDFGARYTVLLASPTGRAVGTTAFATLDVDVSVNEVPDAFDTLVVPGGVPAEFMFTPGVHDIPEEPTPDSVPDAIGMVRKLAPRARRIASVCTGSFVLAALGLLDGRRATTHWAHCQTLARCYPNVEVDPDSLFVQDGPFITGAGITAGIDLALALVCEDHGAAVAQDISKELVVLGRRLEGHPQISVAARTPRPKHPEIDRLLETVNVDPAGHYELDSVAAQLGISPRHLARLFKAQTGMTLRQYVHEVRMENAVALILAGESFRAAARRSGLHYGASVRTHLDARRTRLLADSRSAKAVSIHAG